MTTHPQEDRAFIKKIPTLRSEIGSFFVPRHFYTKTFLITPTQTSENLSIKTHRSRLPSKIHLLFTLIYFQRMWQLSLTLNGKEIGKE